MQQWNRQMVRWLLLMLVDWRGPEIALRFLPVDNRVYHLRFFYMLIFGKAAVLSIM